MRFEILRNLTKLRELDKNHGTLTREIKNKDLELRVALRIVSELDAEASELVTLQTTRFALLARTERLPGCQVSVT